MKKPKLPSLSRIKKALIADWSLRVRTRDGFKCLLCEATENLTAHHWYVSDHHAHTARYAIANGATLCYACHIRGIHSRADFVSVKKLADVLNVTFAAMSGIDLLMKQELTTPLLRELWDAMRKRAIIISPLEMYVKQGKTFVYDIGNQKAVVNNTVALFDDFEDDAHGRCLYTVTTVTKTSSDAFRYTLKPLEDGE
jgi:hypothetical protein